MKIYIILSYKGLKITTFQIDIVYIGNYSVLTYGNELTMLSIRFNLNQTNLINLDKLRYFCGLKLNENILFKNTILRVLLNILRSNFLTNIYMYVKPVLFKKKLS